MAAAASNILIVDLSNYKDRMGSKVDPGRYRVVVDDAENGKSSSGNPMVTMIYRILGGESEGLTVVDRITLTEKALFKMVGFLNAVDRTPKKKRFKLDVKSLVGLKLQVDLVDGEPFKGRVKSEVTGYLRDAGSNKDESDDGPELPEDEDDDDTEEDDETVEEELAEEEVKPKKSKADPVEVYEDDDDSDPEEVDLDDIDV